MDNIKFKLTFGSLSDYRFALKVKIFDGNDRVIQDFKADKEDTIDVEPGIYTIRLELNGILKDHIVRIHKDERFAFRIPPDEKEWKDATRLSLPMIYSSIPFNDEIYDTYKSSHEYYTFACITWSQKSTEKKIKNEPLAASSLFIFFRFPNHEQFETLKNKWSPPFCNSFQLYDEQCVLIKSFDEHNCKINNEVGYLAFNMAVPPGTYYIKATQNNLAQMIPVQVFTNWHSQVFMTLGEQPLYGTLRIILSRERKFDSRSVVNKYVDILTDKIQNNEGELSTELIKYVASHKRESPMLALLCIYAYMNGESDVNDDLIGRMIIVLNELILHNNSKSPDIKAIELLAEKYLGESNVSKKELNSVPMLRHGVQAISEAAMQWPSLIGSNGMLDYAIEGLQRSSVFTVFEWNESNVFQTFDTQIEILTESLTDMIIKSRGIIQKKRLDADQLLEASEKLLKKLMEKEVIKTDKANWFRNIFSTIRKAITSVREPKEIKSEENNINIVHAKEIISNDQSSETAVYIADYVLENPKMNIEEVSINLNIPKPTIERIIEKHD